MVKKIISVLISFLLFSVNLLDTFAENIESESVEYQTFTDDLNDFSKMSSYSKGFEITSVNSGEDKALIMGSASEGAEFVYEMPFEIGSYTIYVYGSSEQSSKIKIYYSKDGKEYVWDRYTEHRQNEGGRVYTDPEVLKDYKFLKIVFETKPTSNNPYISKVVIREEPFVAVGETRIKNTEVSTFDYKSLPSLKEAYKDYFTIGAAIEWFDVEHYPDLLATQFNNMCSENQSRFQGLQPTEGNFNYFWAERLFDFGVQNGMDVRLHALMYYINTPSWVFAQPGGGFVSEDVFLKRYERHIKNVVGHFKGKVKYYDVVNELIDVGMYRPYMNEWKVFGGDKDKFEDFISSCFKWAHEADPDAWLLFLDNNQYNTEKRNITWHQTVESILKKGVPRDKLLLGEQGHFGINDPIYLEDGDNSIEEMLIDAKKMGFKIAITELDLGVSAAAVAKDLNGETIQMNREEREELQAKKYAAIFDLFREYSDIIELVTFWNVTDNTSWRAQGEGSYALLFDYHNEPYSSFYRLFDFEKKLPRWTKEDIMPVVYKNGYTPREIQATYGTPIIDGKLDSVYKKTEQAEIDRQTIGEKGNGAKGNVRCLWDEKNFYAFVEVKDDILNADHPDAWFQDNVELYISETNAKTTEYMNGDNQLRCTIQGETSGKGFGEWTTDCFNAAVVKTKDGYNVEFVYRMGVKEIKEDTILGFDVSITDHIDNSATRRSMRKFCDSIGETHINPKNWGTAKCVYEYSPENISAEFVPDINSERINMEISGKSAAFNMKRDENGEVIVSAKALMEFLAGSIRYNPQTGGIKLIYNNDVLEVKIGSNTVVINGLQSSINTKILKLDGKTMIPVEDVLKCFGIQYNILD